MSRLIDADKLTYHLAVNDEDEQFFYVKSEDIDEQPTVDAVPVVFCYKCKWYHLKNMRGACLNPGVSLWTPEYDNVLPDDYCSRGERREENDTI